MNIIPELYSHAQKAPAVLIFFIIVIDIVFFALFRKYMREYDELARTPVSNIQSAAQGLIQISGKTSANHLSTPVSNLPCCWYEYKIERLDRVAKNSARYVIVESGVSNLPFKISDATGNCYVLPKDLAYTFKAQAKQRRLTRALLGKLGHGGFGGFGATLGVIGNLLGSGRYYYTESYLTSGEMVHVHGYFQTKEFSQLDLNPEETKLFGTEKNKRVNTIAKPTKETKRSFILFKRDKSKLLFKWACGKYIFMLLSFVMSLACIFVIAAKLL